MRLLFFVVLLFLTAAPLVAQQTPATPTDSTIYDFAEQMPIPMLASCVNNHSADWTLDSVRRCADLTLLSLIASNIRYPEEARDKNIQGTVVLSFVVEPTGRISNISILRDIGGGCGPEAVRVLKALDEAGLRWQTAIQGNKVIRLRESLPLRFKLQESLPYFIADSGDTVYTSVDAEPTFRGGMDSLVQYVFNRLEYPKDFEDSCKTGIIEMALLIRPNGTISIENQLDFSNLGLDFQWESNRMARRSAGYWTAAQYKGKPVTTSLPLRAVFKSDRKVCAAANDRFDRAVVISDEGSTLLEQGKTDEAIAKWTAALALQPNNTEFMYYRGTAYLNQNKRDEACADFNRIKTLLGYTWFENIRRLMCGF
jgi:TonB family protein